MSGLGQAGCPPGTTGVPPYCYPTSGEVPDPSGQCPPGQCGWPPYCYPCEPGAQPPAPAQPSGSCPPGTYGWPPYCYGTPTTPEPEPAPAPGAGTCPPGTYGWPPYCYSVPGAMPPGVPGVPGAPAPTPTPPAPGVPTPGVPAPPTPPGVPSVPGAPSVPPEPAPPPPAPALPPKLGWWDQRSDTEKALIIGGAALAGVAVLAGVFGKKKKRPAAAAATPNRRRARRRRARRRTGRRTRRNIRKTRCNRVARRKAAPKMAAFKPVAWTQRERSKLKCAKDKRVGNCHCKAPLKYARMGASRPSDYAYPKCFMYPLYFTSDEQSRKHIRNAAARFAQNLDRYPPDVQRTVYKRIMAAKKAYGIGEFRGVKPPKRRKARRAKPKRRAYRRAA